MILSHSRDIKTKLEASIAGAVAARILSRSSHARITHVFDKSFYAEVGDQLICVLAEDFLNGPINICVNEIPRILDVGTCIEISSTKAKIWEPIKFGPINADRLFENLPESEKLAIIPKGSFRVSLEAGITSGWKGLVGDSGLSIGIDHYGASAPGGTLAEKFGFTPDEVVAKIKQKLQ